LESIIVATIILSNVSMHSLASTTYITDTLYSPMSSIYYYSLNDDSGMCTALQKSL